MLNSFTQTCRYLLFNKKCIRTISNTVGYKSKLHASASTCYGKKAVPQNPILLKNRSISLMNYLLTLLVALSADMFDFLTPLNN